MYRQLCFDFLMPELLEPFILFIYSSEIYYLSTNYESGPALDAGNIAVNKTRFLLRQLCNRTVHKNTCAR